jgi:hypothetical protein
MVGYSYKPTTQEAEAGGLEVRRRPGLPRETLFQKKKVKDHGWMLPSVDEI